MDFNLLLSRIGILQSFMQDFTLLIAIVLMTIAFSFLIGRGRLVAMLISTYLALSILEAVPKGYLTDYSYELIFFFVVLILVTIFSKRIFGIYISGADFMWRIFVVSFLEAGLLLSIIFTITPKKIALSYISENAYKYLVSSEYHLFWLIVPIIFIYFIRKRLN